MDRSKSTETRQRSQPAGPPDAWPVCDIVTLGDRLGGAGWTLVEFWSPTNLFCRLLAPVRVGLPSSHGSRLHLLCCKLDAFDDRCAAFGAVALPALILFHNGRRVRRWLGPVDLSLLRYKIDRTLSERAHEGAETPATEHLADVMS